MGIKDKISAGMDTVKGKEQEALGEITNNDDLVAKGKANQVKGEAKRGFENVKDDLKDAADAVKDSLKDDDR
ncbi:MAG: CsbD family protein [Ruaniaceae bacterium]|nr:CsbD family protein [Ruaniaceae bacterium]